MDISLLLTTLVKLYSLTLLGYLLARRGMLNKEVNTGISRLVVSVTYPCTMLVSMLSTPAGDAASSFILIGGSFVLFCAMVLAAELCARLPIPAELKAPFACLLVFSNTGFIGAPLAQNLYGGGGFFQMNLTNIAYFFFYNTYGLVRICGMVPGEKAKPRVKDFFSIGVLTSILCVVLYLTQLRPPEPVTDVLSLLSGATTPLSMLVLGASLATYPLQQSLRDKWTYIYSACKLLVFPAAGWLLFRLLPLPELFTRYALLTLAMPAGSMVLMLALDKKAPEGFIARSTFVSTLLSAISIPLVLAVFQ